MENSFKICSLLKNTLEVSPWEKELENQLEATRLSTLDYSIVDSKERGSTTKFSISALHFTSSEPVTGVEITVQSRQSVAQCPELLKTIHTFATSEVLAKWQGTLDCSKKLSSLKIQINNNTLSIHVEVFPCKLKFRAE